MQLLLSPSLDGAQVRGLVVDIDDTVYENPAYRADGCQGEIDAIAGILGRDSTAVADAIKTRRQELSTGSGRSVTMTETVLSLGVTRQQWNELRCRAWKPERWLPEDAVLSNLFGRLRSRYRIVFGTNSPVTVGQRVLRAIGVAQAVPDASVFGPENLGVSKPDPTFYVRLALQFGLPPLACLSIGDREAVDGAPAIAAGYAGAIIVSGKRDELLQVGPRLLSDGWRKELGDA